MVSQLRFVFVLRAFSLYLCFSFCRQKKTVRLTDSSTPYNRRTNRHRNGNVRSMRPLRIVPMTASKRDAAMCGERQRAHNKCASESTRIARLSHFDVRASSSTFFPLFFDTLLILLQLAYDRNHSSLETEFSNLSQKGIFRVDEKRKKYSRF